MNPTAVISVITNVLRVRSNTTRVSLFHENRGKFVQGGRYSDHGFLIRVDALNSVGNLSRSSCELIVSAIREEGINGMDEMCISGGSLKRDGLRKRNYFSPYTRG